MVVETKTTLGSCHLIIGSERRSLQRPAASSQGLLDLPVILFFYEEDFTQEDTAETIYLIAQHILLKSGNILSNIS